MKVEYLFTSAEKAELADIDRQIAELYKKKEEIYLRAKFKIVPEFEDENDEFDRFRQYLYGELNLFPKEAISFKAVDTIKERE